MTKTVRKESNALRERVMSDQMDQFRIIKFLSNYEPMYVNLIHNLNLDKKIPRMSLSNYT